MSLQLILGSSGSGKSYKLYQKVIEESVKYPDKRFLVIVPEQYNMQTQKELVSLHPGKGILNIEVLSFQRLAHRIFEEVGADRSRVLDEIGKNLLLRKVAAEQQENLKILGKNLKKTGYITQIKSIISEFMQYDISEDQMKKLIASAQGNPQLHYKLQDVQVLYEGFRKKMQGQYRTVEEALDILCEVTERSQILKNSIIALDGFTGFTPQQQKLMKNLMTHACQILVTVTIDLREDPFRPGGMHQLFYLSKKTIQILMMLAKESGTRIDDPVLTGKETPGRFLKSPALQHLEQHFLRYDRNIFSGKQDEISIHMSRNAQEEVRFAARMVCRLVRENKYRYQDIAVITGEMKSYSPYIPEIFEEYDIPLFLDETKKVILNPFIEFIHAALELAYKNYSYDSVFRYLRTGMCRIGREEIDLLENYVLAVGIKGARAWKSNWDKITPGLQEDLLPRCNEIRQRVINSLEKFTKTVKRKNQNVKEMTTALYELITEHEIQLQLTGYKEAFEAEGRLDDAKEYGQIYGIVIDILDNLVELLGDEILTLKEYMDTLAAGIEEAKVGIIPPTADRVMVGDIERTRLNNIKALIFLGLNDGWVPKHGSSGIITEMERESLVSSGVTLAPTDKENSYIQRFYLYMNLTKPGEKLYLSFGKAGVDGSAMHPSYIIRQIIKMYPDIDVTDEDVYTDPASRILTAKSGIPYLAEGMKDISRGEIKPYWAQLYSWYYQNEAYHEKVKSLVEAAFLKRADRGLGKQVAKALYGETLVNSVSRLELYAACSYAHFLEYGLQLKVREAYVFEPMDMGNIFHKVIEEFSRKVEQSSYSWTNLPEDIQRVWTEECVDEITGEYGARILHSSARNEYAVRRMKRIMHQIGRAHV